jgi:hypothetical protein
MADNAKPTDADLYRFKRKVGYLTRSRFGVRYDIISEIAFPTGYSRHPLKFDRRFIEPALRFHRRSGIST